MSCAPLPHPPDANVANLRQGQAVPASPATLMEVFPDTSVDASATGFVLLQIPRKGGPILWAQDRLSRLSGGPALPCRAWDIPAGSPCRTQKTCRRPYGRWKKACGARRSPASSEKYGATPAALDFTATKRLAMRAEASGVPVWLIRRSCVSQSECCTRALAYCRHAVFPPPRRCTGPRSAPLAPGALPLTLAQAWCLGLPSYDRKTRRLRLSDQLSDGSMADHDGNVRAKRCGMDIPFVLTREGHHGEVVHAANAPARALGMARDAQARGHARVVAQTCAPSLQTPGETTRL